MSMLAERKRKQKWSLNPRGKDWSQDTNKFGQKMLEKMGWQHGKGLGANEDGITEHVKVSYKNDSKGMGYKESDNQWTEHETNFSALLESLTGAVAGTDDLKLNSLEKKSQTSRARVHYHKFTRGKDLSRYSEKDLANIFGKKSLKEPKKEIVEENSSSSIEKLEKDSKFLLNAGSMKDYFKKKLPNFGKSNSFVIGSNGVLKKEESDSECEARPSFSFSNKQNSDTEELNSHTSFGFKTEVVSANSQLNTDPGNKLVQQKNKTTFVSYLNEETNVETNQEKKKKKRKTESVAEETALSPKKKPKKNEGQKSKKLLENDLGLSNPAFNPLYTPVKVQKHVLTTIEETVLEDESILEENSTEIVETAVEVHENKLENVDIALQEGSNNELRCERPKKGNKRRLKSFDTIEVCNSGNQEGCKNRGIIDGLSTYDAKTGVEDSIFYARVEYEEHARNVSDVCEINQENKKKKKRNNFAVDNPNFEEALQESENSSAVVDNPYEIRIKQKKKKKKKDKLVSRSSGGTIASNDSVEFFEVQENPCQLQTSEKKKNTEESILRENSSLSVSTENDTDLCRIEGSFCEIKKKKKKDKKLKSINASDCGSIENSADFTPVEENPHAGKRKTLALENPCFDNAANNSMESSHIEANPYEVKLPEKKKKKKKKQEHLAVENPAFSDATDNMDRDFSQVETNPFEVCVKESKKKTKKKEEAFAIDNPHFDPDSLEQCINNNKYEVAKKRKVSKTTEGNDGVVNPALNLDASPSEIEENMSINIEASDLLLNVVTTPVVSRLNGTNSEDAYSISKANSVKSKKSVRFSDVTQERIIPNNDDLRNLSDIENTNELFDINTQMLNSTLENQNMYNVSPVGAVSTDDKTNQRRKGKKRRLGLDNLAFDEQKNNLDENVDSIAKTLDRYQAEIENDINEKKLQLNMDDIMVGEVGNPHGENQRLSEGTKLKFRYAHFAAKTPFYQLGKTGARKSYKHLIKGDIVIKFNNTNLDEIPGYAIRNKSASF